MNLWDTVIKGIFSLFVCSFCSLLLVTNLPINIILSDQVTNKPKRCVLCPCEHVECLMFLRAPRKTTIHYKKIQHNDCLNLPNLYSHIIKSWMVLPNKYSYSYRYIRKSILLWCFLRVFSGFMWFCETCCNKRHIFFVCLFFLLTITGRNEAIIVELKELFVLNGTFITGLF